MAQVEDGLRCMNCGTPVGSEARIFASVFCCLTCYTLAERLLQRVQMELQRLMSMSKEAIRVALVEGKLHYGTKDEEPSKKALLEMIVQMSENKNARPKTTP